MSTVTVSGAIPSFDSSTDPTAYKTAEKALENIVKTGSKIYAFGFGDVDQYKTAKKMLRDITSDGVISDGEIKGLFKLFRGGCPALALDAFGMEYTSTESYADEVDEDGSPMYSKKQIAKFEKEDSQSLEDQKTFSKAMHDLEEAHIPSYTLDFDE